jgi:tetratricopeptide (TPR) repeat protein
MELWRESPWAATEFARKALQHEEKNPQIFFHLGRALVAMVEENASPEARETAYDEAIAAYERARSVAPLEGGYTLEIAFLHGELGRYAEAEKLYQVALERDPRSRSVAELYRYHRESWKQSGQTDTLETEPGSTPKEEEQ